MTADDTETQRVEVERISSTMPLDETETRRAEIEDWLIDNRWPNAYDLSDEIVKAPWFTAARASGDDLAVERAWDEGASTALNYAIRNVDSVTLRLDKPNPYRIARTNPGEGGAE